MAESNRDLFRKLTRIFRSGPIVRQRIVNSPTSQVKSTATQYLRRSTSNVYGNAINAYGTFDRLSRYSDFSEMDYTPMCSTALNLIADEVLADDERGNSLQIYSENPKIRKILEELFKETLNFEFNGRTWVRNLAKYGDFFLFNEVAPKYGVMNVIPIPVNEVERLEGWDPNNPTAVKFQWTTNGNQELEEWQVTHFRITGNDTFLPYGCSILESGRRTWRQYIMAVDAMLVYRVIRSPERRVFYIDVGNAPPNEIEQMVEQAHKTLKAQQVVDNTTGRVDLRYNPYSVDMDYVIPIRGDKVNTRIDTLAGGVNTTAIDDVEFIQNELISSLGVPKPYLGYSEMAGKSNLSAEDVRFARTIRSIQKVVITELKRLAFIHLYALGYRGEDLFNFDILLSNPSTMSQMQKLDLVGKKLEILGTRPDDTMPLSWFWKNVFHMSKEEIEKLESDYIDEKIRMAQIDQGIGSAIEGSEGGGGLGGGGGGGFGGGGGDFDFGDGDDLDSELPSDDEEAEDAGGEEDVEDLFASEKKKVGPLISDDEDHTLGEDEEETKRLKSNPLARFKHNNLSPSRRKKRGFTNIKQKNPYDAIRLDNPDYKDINGDRVHKGNPFNLGDSYNRRLREDDVYDRHMRVSLMESEKFSFDSHELHKLLKTLPEEISINKTTLLEDDNKLSLRDDEEVFLEIAEEIEEETYND